jgi:hypothetical protein
MIICRDMRSSSKAPKNSVEIKMHSPIFSPTRPGRLGARFKVPVKRFPLRFSISKRGLHSFFVNKGRVIEMRFVPSDVGKINCLNLVTVKIELAQPFQILKAVDAGNTIAISSQLPQVPKTLQSWRCMSARQPRF